MNSFQVDHDVCDACENCIETCSLNLIEMRDLTPAWIQGAEEICENCGHCVAVCPQAAVSLDIMTPDQCPPILQDLNISFEQAGQFFRSRRSVREFKPEAVDRGVLTKLLTTANYSATGMNAQMVNWAVFSNQNDIREMAEITMQWMRSFHETLSPSFLKRIVAQAMKIWDKGEDSICHTAPHMIIAYGSHNDCMIAATQLSLAAPSIGLGSCWSGWVMIAAENFSAMQEFLGLPEGQSCQAAMMLGQPIYEYPRMPLRNEPQIIWR